jgi:hypothetical protein
MKNSLKQIIILHEEYPSGKFSVQSKRSEEFSCAELFDEEVSSGEFDYESINVK